MKRPLQRMASLAGGAVIGTAMAATGCWQFPSAQTFSRNYSFGDAPVDPPYQCDGGKFDDVTRGGQLFKYYCGSCHNARALGERPFSNYNVAMAHMREQAYLTGKEYREIVHFLRRWHDVGPPTPDVETSPKRFIYSQPLSELRPPDAKPEAPQLPAPAPVKQDGADKSAGRLPEVTTDPGPTGTEIPKSP